MLLLPVTEKVKVKVEEKRQEIKLKLEVCVFERLCLFKQRVDFVLESWLLVFNIQGSTDSRVGLEARGRNRWEGWGSSQVGTIFILSGRFPKSKVWN